MRSFFLQTTSLIFGCLVASLVAVAVGAHDDVNHPADIDVMIQRVETGLTGGAKFKGEKSWTIEERMKHHGVPGLSLAVIQDNKVVWSKAYGVKDRETREPVTTDTLFQCASISKPVSSAAALRLVEKGMLDLQVDVNQALKTWKLPENEFTRDKKVTLEHLISHKGGVTVHGFLGYGEDLPVPSLVELLDGAGPANSPPIRVDKLPGGSFRYSGGGYCIMQQLMMDVTGKPFPAIMEDELLKPLGMERCTFEQPLPASRAKEAATGYLEDGEVVSGKRHTYPEMAPAGLYANATELAQFFIEIQLACKGDSEKLLSQAMAKRMTTVGSGLGIGVDDKAGEVYIGHGGWNEGFSSDTTFHRDRGYGVVVLTNGNQPPLIDEVIAAVARAYDWDNFGLPEYEKLKTSATEMSKLTGRYNRDGSLIKIFAKDDQLMMMPNEGEAIAIHRVGEETFACETMNALICFAKSDADGQTQIEFRNPWDKEVHPSNVAKKLKDGEKLPAEWIVEGEFETALAAYQAMQKENPASPAIQEERLNDIGYGWIEKDRLDMAIAIFRINTMLYPDAFNAFDSLGEAYMAAGKKELGIFNYKKSLKLNPENSYAAEVIKRFATTKDD